jgi:hypothetical protein
MDALNATSPYCRWLVFKRSVKLSSSPLLGKSFRLGPVNAVA